jgi:recombination protein RecR
VERPAPVSADIGAPRVLTPAIEGLVAELARLPGIGPRSAQRLAFHLLRAPSERPAALAQALETVAERVDLCKECFSFAEDGTCPLCSDPRRDDSVICVVEEPSAILPIERTQEYRGRYHVLGGALSPIDGISPDDLRIDELVARVDRLGVRELVIATNPTMAGEATALYLADMLRGTARVTRLASGLPVGADLEHADELTLGRALAGRQEL